MFTPSDTDPKDLERIFVQRQSLLDDAIERVSESARTKNKHQLLFVGPRGCGKTFLVTLLVHRIDGNEELTDKLHIAWLNEDETTASLLDLLLRIHRALAKRYPRVYEPNAIEGVFELDPRSAEVEVGNAILKRLSNRTLLIVVENLDDLFDGLGERGQKALRAFVQEHPVVSLVATAQSLTPGLARRTSPFFGFFQTEHLLPLSVPKTVTLLRQLALLKRQPEVAEFLQTASGVARVRALHHLSEGNHRIVVVLSQFVTLNSIDTLVGPFRKMVDELTPYYQEPLRALPAQQRKIIEYLCLAETAVPVKQIARQLFTSSQSISSQLRNLREQGYVLSSPYGRESLYQIADPLMRICMEVKENRNQEPLRLLVDFLRTWYDARDLDHRLERGNLRSETGSYRQFAIEGRSNGDVLSDISIAYGHGGEHENAIKDLSRVIEVKGAPADQTVDASLMLAERQVAAGRWAEGISSLEVGLRAGHGASPHYLGDATRLVRVVFDLGLETQVRRERVAELAEVFRHHQGASTLGQGLIRHLGTMVRERTELPDAMGLGRWSQAWIEATRNHDEYRLPMRIFRVGIAFLQGGGEDARVLGSLRIEERAILEQALGLDDPEELRDN